MTNDFAAIPSGIQSRLSELSKHEYWGDDFAAGKCEFLIARKDNGRIILVCTFGGCWAYHLKGMQSYECVNLRHTQTGTVTFTEAGPDADVVNKDNVAEMIAKYGDKKSPTWTLK